MCDSGSYTHTVPRGCDWFPTPHGPGVVVNYTAACHARANELIFPRYRYSGLQLSCKLRYIVGIGLVEIAISTNPMPMIYRNLYKDTGEENIMFSHPLWKFNIVGASLVYT